MADYQYVRWFPADYVRDTRRFSQAEHGAYLLLLNEYYLTGGPLPDDDKVLSRITLSDTLSDWLALRSVLAERFQVADGVWRHKRCDKEIAQAKSTREARVKGALATNAQRDAQRLAQRDAQRPLSDTQPEPEPDKGAARAREGERPGYLSDEDDRRVELKRRGWNDEQIDWAEEELARRRQGFKPASYLHTMLSGEFGTNGTAPKRQEAYLPRAQDQPDYAEFMAKYGESYGDAGGNHTA